MTSIQTYRDLPVWQKSKQLAMEIHLATAALPPSELLGLTSHMRCAAISIPSAIAESYAKATPAEYIRGLRSAAGSLAKLATQWELAAELNLLSLDSDVPGQIAELDRMLSSLIHKLTSK